MILYAIVIFICAFFVCVLGMFFVCAQEQSFLKRDKSAPAITQNLFVEIVRENAAKMYRSDGVSDTAVFVTITVTVTVTVAVTAYRLLAQ
jgi:hypothetical protein